jgi:hypothetical protein
MNTHALNWKTWLKHGDQYLKAATPKGAKSRFDTDIRYNLLSLSLEGYIMAILDYHQDLPFNHTYTDLVTALETVVPVNEALKNRILQYENIQSICSIEKYHRSKPSEEELDDLKGAVIEIRAIAHQKCVPPCSQGA